MIPLVFIFLFCVRFRPHYLDFESSIFLSLQAGGSEPWQQRKRLEGPKSDDTDMTGLRVGLDRDEIGIGMGWEAERFCHLFGLPAGRLAGERDSLDGWM